MLHFHASAKQLSSVLEYSLNASHHPPLFYLIYRPITLMVPFGEENLRIFHVLLGLITAFLPMFYKNILSIKKSCLITTFLLANIILIQWSKEALTYPLALLFITLFYFSLKNFEEKRSVRTAVVLGFVILLNLYTHYFSAFIVTSFTFISFLQNIKNIRLRKQFLYIFLSLFILYTPWIYNNHLYLKFTSHSPPGHWHTPGTFMSEFLKSIDFIFYFNKTYLISSFSIFLVIFFIRREKILTKSFIRLSITFISYSILLHMLGAFHHKYLLLLVPFICIEIVNILYSWNRSFSSFVIIALCILSLSLSGLNRSPMGFQNPRDAILKVKELDKNKRLVTIAYNPRVYRAYYKKYKIVGHYKRIYNDYKTVCNDPEEIKRILVSLEKDDVIIDSFFQCGRTTSNTLKSLSIKYDAFRYRSVNVYVIN
jgi:hypothetical protein